MYTTLTIKMPKTIRSEAKALADDLGLSLSTVINAFLRQFIKEQKFSVSAEKMPSKRSIALMEQISAEMDKDPNPKRFTNAEELFRHLKI
ncbi:MAG: hypothetical protein M1459_01905 [Patescibacteria group bacterium]|nr:hypothetical protein [Patescibacteria group bacterium]